MSDNIPGYAMKLLLNDQELTDAVPESATLGAALTTVQERHIAEDEVISIILIDDEPLTADLLAEWKNRPVEEFATVQIEAPKRNILASNGLRLLSQGLAESNEQRQEIVDHICQARHAQAMDLLTGYLSLWDSIQQSLGSAARLIDVELESLEIYEISENPDVQSVMGRIQQLTEQLKQLQDALEAQDLVLLGDILEYEFGPLTEDWQQMLEHLANRFETRDFDSQSN
jgi:hypothetical protein